MQEPTRAADTTDIIGFVRAVDWGDECAVAETAHVLAQWPTVGLADALMLLGSDKVFRHEAVRSAAVAGLAELPDADLQYFLLPLVYALQYEVEGSLDEKTSDPHGTDPAASGTVLGPLGRFLVRRCGQSIETTNFVFWHLQSVTAHIEVFGEIRDQFLTELKNDPEMAALVESLLSAKDVLDQLASVHAAARETPGRAAVKEQKLRALLEQFSWPGTATVRLPLAPTMCVEGLVPASTAMFKRLGYPFVVEFVPPKNALPDQSADVEPFRAIVKTNSRGLRRDQFISHALLLLGALLRREGLDWHPVLPRVLVASGSLGLVAFLRASTPLATVLASSAEPQVLSFLAAHNADANAVLEHFARPFAASSVLAFVLGICDRTAETVLLTPRGGVASVSFDVAFRIGHYPLLRDLVDALGGPEREPYALVKSYCVRAFLAVRNGADVVVAWMGLMADSGLERLDEATAFVRQQLRLDVDDAQAETHLLSLLDEALAFREPLVEMIHRQAVKPRPRDSTALDGFLADQDSASAVGVWADLLSLRVDAPLRHSKIVALVGVEWTKATEIQALSEWMDGGDLRGLLAYELAASLSWEDSKCQLAIDVAEALAFLGATAAAVDRSFTSRKVLLGADGRAKLQLLRASVSDSHAIRWAAPEVLVGGAVSEASTIYSLGVLLYELDTLHLPYHDAVNPNGAWIEDELLGKRIAARELPLSFSVECPAAVADLARRCLSHDPVTRPRASAVAYALRGILKNGF